MSRPDPINEGAVVLWRCEAGEYDRWAALLTENHGRLFVRFGGVNRPLGKLKALSEPLVWGEYRLYFSPGSQAARVVGGRIESCFPGLRGDLARTLQALSCCEMAMHMTLERAPSPAKYRLLCRALCVLDQGESPWLEIAFGLKLLDSAGYSLRELPVPPAQRWLWRALHDAPLEGAAGLPWQAAAGERFLRVVYDHVEAHAERALRSRGVAMRLELLAQGLRAPPDFRNASVKEKVPC